MSTPPNIPQVMVQRWATAIIAVIVVIIGGIVTITNPDTLPFASYLKDVALGAGALGIGYGLDSHSRP